jgi:glycerol-3-phosphate acyltransferase
MASNDILKFFLFFHRWKFANSKLYRRTMSKKILTCSSQSASLPSFDDITNKTFVIDMDEWLLKSNSTFPYFMLVALEGGGFLRGFLLLFLYSFLQFFSEEVMLRVMVMVCFFGMKVDGFRLDRAILPKYFLENVALEGFEVLKKGLKEAKEVVCVSRRMPRVMVDGFLRDYMGVKEVAAREIGMKNGLFSGTLMDWDDKKLVRKLEAIGGDVMVFGSGFAKDSQQKSHLFSVRNSFKTFQFCLYIIYLFYLFTFMTYLLHISFDNRHI